VKKDADWQRRFREDEAKVNVGVIDTDETTQPCRACGESRLVFFVHCFREPDRPLAGLCKPCTIARAGGEEKVYVKTAPGPWLRKRWQADQKLPKASEKRLAAVRKAARASLLSRKR
jgi:hypothetical protein